MRAVKLDKRTVTMSPAEQAALWRQRFFEAQAGMERYLIETYGLEEVERWLPVKIELLAGVDGESFANGDAQRWKELFFRAQARLERYVAAHHGLRDLEGWTAGIASVFKFTEPDCGGGAADYAMRLARQAQCYGSEYEITETGAERAAVVLHHCAIWDYREEARRKGVALTLASPCTFCSKSIAANARAKGLVASFELHADGGHHGCTWEIKNENSGQR